MGESAYQAGRRIAPFTLRPFFFGGGADVPKPDKTDPPTTEPAKKVSKRNRRRNKK